MPPKFIQQKVDQAFAIIDDAMSKMERPYVSVSWGKDSTVLLWVALQYMPSIPVVHFANPAALPDDLAHRDYILNQWNISQYIEVPRGTLAEYIETIHHVGLPDINRYGSGQKRFVDQIKKNPGKSVAENHGFDGVLWGLRADESQTRRKAIKKWGTVYRHRDGLLRCAPLAWWKNTDLWAVIDHYKIPYSTIYDKTLFEPREKIRNGGWLTTDGAWRGRCVWLKHYYPDTFNRLAAEFPEVRNYV